MQFTQKHQDIFRILSGDRNPLHTDPEYAKRTSFGQVLVFGMGAVLYALGQWAEGRRFTLRKIRADFKHPLFLEENYRIEWETNGYTTKLRILKEERIHVALLFDWSPWTEEAKGTTDDSDGVPRTLQQPLEGRTFAELPEDLRYVLNRSALEELAEHFSLSAKLLPLSQLTCLAWASYFVGMIYPGKQALFGGFQFEFLSDESSCRFLPENLRATRDDRFNLFKIEGSSKTGGFFLNAFLRPLPVRHDIASIIAVCGRTARLAGKTALVSGSSRGFGAVLARACACHGADVVVNYKSLRSEAEAVATDIRELNQRAWVLGGDVGLKLDCVRIRQELEHAGAKLDFLVLNASPTIRAMSFSHQSSQEFCAFVDACVKMGSVPVRTLLPILAEDSTIILVSSSYAVNAEPQFSHYVTAKSALEGLVRALSVEHSKKHFMIARLPRILTDQTNLPFQIQEPASAVSMAASLLAELPISSPHVVEINLT